MPSDLRERCRTGRAEPETHRSSSRSRPGVRRGWRERTARTDGTEEPHRFRAPEDPYHDRAGFPSATPRHRPKGACSHRGEASRPETGPAGSGKSVVAETRWPFSPANSSPFGFRVEEFAVAHIDETFTTARFPARATELQAILGGSQVLVIESVERLLEKPTRDAFSDLMTLAQGDDGLGILMTCRNYSVEQVQPASQARD